MSMSRRHFVSGAAIAGANAALPTSAAGEEETPPLGDVDDINVFLDLMESQIGTIRNHLAETETYPAAVRSVQMEAVVLDHRAQSFAHRARVLRNLSLGQSLAEQRAERERKRRAARNAGHDARTRLNEMKALSELIAHVPASSMGNYAEFMARDLLRLEADMERVLRLIT